MVRGIYFVLHFNVVAVSTCSTDISIKHLLLRSGVMIAT
jgi:hypothetical protein